MILAWLAAAWLAGIAAAAMLGAAAWPLALAIAAACLAAALYWRSRAFALYALVLPAVFAAGVLRFEEARPHLAADAAARFNDGVAMRVRGVLRDDPEIRDTSQRFAVDLRAVELRGEWTPASGGVLVRGGLLPRYRSGDVVELEGKIESPPHLDGFDYGEYLQRKGIASVMQYPAIRTTGHEDDNLVRATILTVRRRLSGALGLALPEPQSSLAQGVLLGQRSALPQDLAGDLNATNTSHLVVVSGENVVLVSAYATLAFAWLAGRRRALALSIAAVIAYALLVGASPPVMRAAIMGILLVAAQLAGRPTNGRVSILLAAAIMAGLDGSVVRDVSFQLSFAATAGIIYLASPLRGWIIEALARLLRRDDVPRWMSGFFAEPLAITLAAIISTTPLLALNFGRVSLVAIPANLLVVPMFPVILGASLLAALGGLIPHTHLALAWPAYYALTYWIEVAQRLAGLPGASLTLHGYSSPWAATTYSAITVLAFVGLRRLRFEHSVRLAESRPFSIRRLSPVAMLGVPAVALVASAGFAFWPSPPRRLQVTVLDVGQGDAILIETPSGDDILVDGGPGRAVLRGLGDELSWHDRDIELMILTHPQADHLAGLLDVLARYDVRRVLAGPGIGPSAGYRAWLAALGDEGVRPEIAHQGQRFDLGGGVTMQVIGPDDVEAVDRQINNTGAVVKITWGDVSFLLTGDIQAAAERALLDDAVDLRATVLKVAHHGSKTSSTREFLDAVRPTVAVVSSGKDNVFGHPARDVVERLRRYADVYNTADAGAVHFETDGHRVWVSTGD